MKVGVLGSGGVAQTLGAGFLRHGHEVMLGTRTVTKLADWAAAHPGAKVGSFAETGAFGEILVLAVKGDAAAATLQAIGAANLQGKTILDATNPIAPAAPEQGVLKYFTTLEDSLLEGLQREFPDARLVKAFNSVGAASMVNPSFAGGKPSMFICGDDAPAKETARQILDQFGWETEDLGGAIAARAIEPLCMLWCIPGFLHNDWRHAFKILR